MPSASLPANFVESYARPPAQTTVDRAVTVHRGVRELLGDVDYLTVLQGSYKNDTALWDMNDVDITAVARNIVSTTFTGLSARDPIHWTEIFARIERKLQADSRYIGKWTRQDKCIRLHTDIKIDIVPAIRIGEAETDPIAIFSFRTGAERKNLPRTHYDLAAAKSGRTNGNFKKTVRLFKRWAKCWFGTRKVAPSYYLECLVYAQDDGLFAGDLAGTFVAIGDIALGMKHGQSVLARIAGEGNLLSEIEWTGAQFAEFQRDLGLALPYAKEARRAAYETSARQYWTSAFNGRPPS